MTLLRLYLGAAFSVCLFSFVVQAFVPGEAAAASVWGFAPGWQREIGFFNLAVALIALSALRIDDLRSQRSVALAIVVLTTLVGTNHLATVLSGRTSWLHNVFTGVNYAGVALGCAALFASRSSRSYAAAKSGN